MLLATGAQGQPTPHTELVVYGIDSGPPDELLHYVFDTDTVTSIGAIVDQNGTNLDHPESLTYIPSGPHLGFYTVPSGRDFGGPRNMLAKIDLLNASAQLYPVQIGFRQIQSMNSIREPNGDWTLYAFARRLGDGTLAHQLITIDLDTGLGTTVMMVTQHYQGLSDHPADNKLFGITESQELWIIDYNNMTETLVGPTLQPGRVEALEYAYGDNAKNINLTGIPGVTPAWTAQGILFTFGDMDEGGVGLSIVNPGTGENVPYPSTFSLTDCEGLVFFTKTTDPFGKILVEVFD